MKLLREKRTIGRLLLDSQMWRNIAKGRNSSILRKMPEYADLEVVPAEDIDEDDETTE